jgi:tetratricopeptide (TPR) repeat protein
VPFEELRRRQQIRHAEGYLDLLMAFADKWTLTTGLRDRLGCRALDALREIRATERQKGYVEYLRGQALRAMEHYHDAIAPLKRSAEADPDNVNAYLALGWCYKRIGRLDAAIQSLEEAMEFAPEQAILHYNLACYWSLSKNKSTAIQYLSQAFELDGKYRELASDESDFDGIRDDPEFQMLTNVVV